MSMEHSSQSIVIDATALIDFLDSDRSIVPLISKHLGKLHVIKPVFEEVNGLHESQCEPLGITIVDLTLDQYKEAGSFVGGLARASFLHATMAGCALQMISACEVSVAGTALMQTAPNRYLVPRPAPPIMSLKPCNRLQPARQTSSPTRRNGACQRGQHDNPRAA